MVDEHKFFGAILADFLADFEKIKADFLKSLKIEIGTSLSFQ